MRKGGVGTCCLAVAWLLCADLVAQDATPRPEYQLKAAVVSKFAEFIDWPDAAFAGRPAFELCVVRPNPFGNTLAALLNGASIHGRPVATTEIADARAIGTCHVLVIPTLPSSQQREILTRTATLPVLTVGDSPKFLDDGGIIGLRVVNGRIRFDVSLTAATRAKLKVSSQLLSLALSVRGGRP